MAFYYVKSGGTATGDGGRYSTEQTGSFAALGVSGYYDSVYDVFAGSVPTTAPDGDFIVLSNLHSETVSATLAITVASQYLANTLVSVDDTSVSVYKRGAAITSTGAMTLSSSSSQKSSYYFKGVDVTTAGNLTLGNRESTATFDDCNIDCTTSGIITNYSANGMLKFIDSEVNAKQISNGMVDVCGGMVSLHNWVGALSSTVSFDAKSCDFSGSTTDSIHQLRIVNPVKFISCKLPTSWLLLPNYQNESESAVFKMEAISCHTDDDYNYHATHIHEGLITTSDVTWLFYEAEKSYLLNSFSWVSKGLPLKHKLCEIPAQDLSAGDTTYRVNLLLDTTTVATLTDANFWIELMHSNNDALALGDVVNSRNSDILATGTELTASSETWQGTLPTNTKAYQVDIPLTASQLINVTNGSVVVYINIATPNTDVYVCPAVQIGK